MAIDPYASKPFGMQKVPEIPFIMRLIEDCGRLAFVDYLLDHMPDLKKQITHDVYHKLLQLYTDDKIVESTHVFKNQFQLSQQAVRGDIVNNTNVEALFLKMKATYGVPLTGVSFANDFCTGYSGYAEVPGSAIRWMFENTTPDERPAVTLQARCDMVSMALRNADYGYLTWYEQQGYEWPWATFNPEGTLQVETLDDFGGGAFGGGAFGGGGFGGGGFGFGGGGPPSVPLTLEQWASQFDFMAQAVSTQRVDLVEFLLTRTPPCPMGLKVLKTAISYGNIPFLKSMRAKGAPWNSALWRVVISLYSFQNQNGENVHTQVEALLLWLSDPIDPCPRPTGDASIQVPLSICDLFSIPNAHMKRAIHFCRNVLKPPFEWNAYVSSPLYSHVVLIYNLYRPPFPRRQS